MKKILTLPTWQVFLLLIIPFFLPPISYLSVAILIAWGIIIAYCTYFIGNNLYEKLPVGHDLNIKRFNFQLFFPLIYIVVILLVFKGGYRIDQSNYKDYGWLAKVIIPLHIYAMFCMFYVIWFIAKAIATIEYNHVVGLDVYLGNFFLLWFFPIGIWWIHPKVRKIFSEDTETLAEPDQV
jgi:hypothetical protein